SERSARFQESLAVELRRRSWLGGRNFWMLAQFGTAETDAMMGPASGTPNCGRLSLICALNPETRMASRNPFAVLPVNRVPPKNQMTGIILAFLRLKGDGVLVVEKVHRTGSLGSLDAIEKQLPIAGATVFGRVVELISFAVRKRSDAYGHERR